MLDSTPSQEEAHPLKNFINKAKPPPCSSLRDAVRSSDSDSSHLEQSLENVNSDVEDEKQSELEKEEEFSEDLTNQVVQEEVHRPIPVNSFSTTRQTLKSKKLQFFAQIPYYPKFDSCEKALALLKQEGHQLKAYLKDVHQTAIKFNKDGVVEFPLKERWLKGEEYGFLLRHYHTFSKHLKRFQVFDRAQPMQVYQNPEHGMLYFIKGQHLREFGFPRQGSQHSHKLFKWKKTNFVTDLPKHAPVSRYLVAKTKFEGGEYFMHAAVLLPEYHDDYKNRVALEKMRGRKAKLREEDQEINVNSDRLIVCHIFKKESKSEKSAARQLKSDEQLDDNLREEIYAESFEDYDQTLVEEERKSEDEKEEDEVAQAKEVSEDHNLQDQIQGFEPCGRSPHKALRRSVRLSRPKPYGGSKTTFKGTFQKSKATKSAKTKQNHTAKQTVQKSQKLNKSFTPNLKDLRNTGKDTKQVKQHEVDDCELDNTDDSLYYQSSGDEQVPDLRMNNDILKSYQHKLKKWLGSSRSIVRKWKVNHYEFKVNKWKRRVASCPKVQEQSRPQRKQRDPPQQSLNYQLKEKINNNITPYQYQSQLGKRTITQNMYRNQDNQGEQNSLERGQQRPKLTPYHFKKSNLKIGTKNRQLQDTNKATYKSQKEAYPSISSLGNRLFAVYRTEKNSNTQNGKYNVTFSRDLQSQSSSSFNNNGSSNQSKSISSTKDPFIKLED